MNWKNILGVLFIFSISVSAFQTPVSSYGALITEGSNIVSSITKEPV
ncbi:MAG TPA: hypothetical protein PLT31_08025 [Fibrobacteraceae bacterium]|jgi:hypothetical protein|nr:hypothetical protein [Fibrobacter sp.]HPW95113.1 hypothetical protein [Fibrobacteraceae bacterium]